MKFKSRMEEYVWSQAMAAAGNPSAGDSAVIDYRDRIEACPHGVSVYEDCLDKVCRKERMFNSVSVSEIIANRGEWHRTNIHSTCVRSLPDNADHVLGWSRGSGFRVCSYDDKMDVWRTREGNPVAHDPAFWCAIPHLRSEMKTAEKVRP